MKEDWLNKKLEEKLDGYDSPMHVENAWESFQTKRQAPKKKNRYFIFWILLGLLTFGIGGSYFYSNNLSDKNHNPHANTFTEKNNTSKNNDSVFEKTKSSSPIPSNTEKINQPNKAANIFTQNKTIQNNSKNRNFENQNYSNKKETKSIVDGTAPISKSDNNNINTLNTNLDFPKKSNFNSIFPIENEVKNESVIDSTIPKKEVQPMAVLFLPSLRMNLLEVTQKGNFEKLDASFSLFQTQYPTYPVAPNYFGIVAGYGIRNQGKVFSQEKPLDLISVNVFYENRFGSSSLYFKSGISFDQFVNSIEITSDLPFTQLLDNQLIAINQFQNGTSQFVLGTAEISMIEKTTSKNFNRYRLISIPIILGYDVISSNTMSLQIEGGIARSIFGIHSGKYFDLVNSDFKKQRVWQGLYGLNFNFKTNSRTNIFTSIKGNYHFNKIGKSEQLEMEKFRFHQIQVGIRYKL